MGDTAAFVEILSAPDGEASLWVREKWVGLRLPLATRKRKPIRVRTLGVLTTPHTAFGQFLALLRGKTSRETGFVVQVIAAIAILEESSPEAAAWWRENAAYLFRKNRHFLFGQSCGRLCP